MQDIDTLIHARWIIPVEPRGQVLEDHSLAIHDGRILALGPRADMEAAYHAHTTQDMPRHALIPGLVNAHTHASMTLMRGLADDLPLMEWLKNHIWPAEGRWVGPDFVHDGTELAVAEMLRGGTTCFNDMYFFPDTTARAAAAAGIRANVGLIVIDFPTPWAENAEEYLRKGVEVHDNFRTDPLVTTAFAPHAPYTVSDDPLRRIAVYADELDIPVHMHVHETTQEVDEAVRHNGQRPLARLAELGLLTPRLLAVHFTQRGDGEVAALAEAGAHVVHCPESNLKLASGFCPVAELQAAGVNVALGTDGAASNNDLDMFGEMRSAALLGKAVAGAASAVSAESALEMATLAGARALGLDDQLGSLAPGKAADMVAVDLGGIETQPVYHPVSQIVYTAGRDKVTDVWVAGRHLLKDGALTTLDEDDLLDRAATWQARIRENA